MTIAAVVIGRNEGERLNACLESLTQTATGPIVYVDSNSSDNSVSLARQWTSHVVELDPAIPMTAARARNAGLAYLSNELNGTAEFVQFIDGDCSLFADWIDSASSVLEQDAKLAIVCGRRRERFPEGSIYNQMCDQEWNTPVGEAKSCGGDFLARSKALGEVGAFNSTLIAGEEPEMCIRLRQAGWSIRRIANDMTLHDAALHSFSQWMRRSIRGGFAYAQGMSMHGSAPERHCVRQTIRATAWGGIVPAAGALVTFAYGPIGLLLFTVYPLKVLRMYMKQSQPIGYRRLRFATLGVILNVLEFAGVLRFAGDRLMHKKSELIEYK